MSTKNLRSAEDATALIGMGATDIFGSIATSLHGMDAFPPAFTACHDIPANGVLLALAALLAMGLLKHSEKYFELPKEFYRLDSIFLVLAFMALARIKSAEKLRYFSPGEWGKLSGLDRIPEAKTLREKIGILSQQGEPCQWAEELNREWMRLSPAWRLKFPLNRLYLSYRSRRIYITSP